MTIAIKQRPFRPLLAATIEDNNTLDVLQYPLIASPKVDGIRVLCHPEFGPVTRSVKPVRNHHIRNMLSMAVYEGFDGEIVSGPITAPNVFNRTTTAVMTMDSCPVFTYYVFDHMFSDKNYRYGDRLAYTQGRCSTKNTPYARILPSRQVDNPAEVLEAEIEWLAQGFEGIMLRSPNAPYKYGRSTLKEQILMKLKRFKDAEAVIIGFEPLFSNQNPQTRNSQGLSERSDHKAGKIQMETLGNLVVRSERAEFSEFNVGSGFDSALRDEIWNNRQKYLGRTITFKYQEVGIVDKPRFPIFLRFREGE